MHPEIADFVQGMRDLRMRAGERSLRDLGYRIHTSAATLSRMLSGRRLPSWEIVRSFIEACGDNEAINYWHAQYHRARRAHQAATSLQAAEEARSDANTATTDEADEWGSVLSAAATYRELVVALRALKEQSGLTIRELERRTAYSRSTISDALSGVRAPHPELVGAIARACGTEPDPWIAAARQVRRPNRAPIAPKGDTAEKPFTQVLLTVAANRSPADIAQLAVDLRDAGEQTLSENLLQMVARTRPVDEVAAVAIALLHAGAGTKNKWRGLLGRIRG